MTKERDRELDEIEEELRRAEAGSRAQPFIERPAKLDAGQGVLCWLDGSRKCGADCVAFNPDEVDAGGLASDSPNKCLVLTYMGQQGAAALAIISASRTAAKKAQDERRQAAANQPVPSVGGKKDE